MGFYPTPLSVVDRIRSFIIPPEHQVNAFDPCCGEGIALKRFAEGHDCGTYGIELDNFRAEQAKANIDHILKGSFADARVTNGCFSVLFLNPPYDDETLSDGITTDSERKEKVFLKDSIRYLQPGGLLIYIIPQARLDKAIARILCYRFEDFMVFRFHGEEYDAFKQIVVFAVKKKQPGIDVEHFQKLARARTESLPEIPILEKPVYALPKAKAVSRFMSSIIDLADLEKEAKASPLWRWLESLIVQDEKEMERPLLPHHQGHIAQLLVTGNVSGVFGDGNDRHVVRGKVQKVVITQIEYNGGTVEERELDQYKVSLKVLTIGGMIRELV
jgi:hypothetical protein